MPTPWSSPTSKYLKLIQIIGQPEKKNNALRPKESMPFLFVRNLKEMWRENEAKRLKAPFEA